MKSILLTIRLKYFYLTYKGIKNIEIRKSAPKNFAGDVYEIISKTNFEKDLMEIPENEKEFFKQFKGKIGLKFTLNKIERFINGMNELELEWDGKPDAEYDYFAYEKALEKACLTYEEAEEYAPDQSFYAWHISDLQIFDEPKEISEFKYEKKKVRLTKKYHWKTERLGLVPVKKAPQSWQYVEEKE